MSERKVVVRYRSLEALPDIYRTLFDYIQREGDFFSTLEWYRVFFERVLSGEHDLYLLGVQDTLGKKAFALLPLCVKKGVNFFGGFRTLSSANNYYASLFSLISNEEDAGTKESIILLVKYIASQKGKWSKVDLRPMSNQDGRIQQFDQAFKENGWDVRQYFCFGNWYLKVGDIYFSDYWEKIPSRIKNTLKRKQKAFEQIPNFKMQIIKDKAQIENCVAAFDRVYRASWKRYETYPEFIRELIKMVAMQGKLRLGIIQIGELPIAVQFWIVHRQSALIYKLAYDHRYEHLSPGTVLTAHMIKQITEHDHVMEVDYLNGDEIYKRDWMSDRRERWGLMAFNRKSLIGHLFIFRHITIPNLKTYLSRYFYSGIFSQRN